MSEQWYSPGYQRVGIPRQRVAGVEVWRFPLRDGQVQSCEVRDDTRHGAGWDVMILIDGEPMFSRRCADKTEADYVARVLESDARNEARSFNPIGRR